MYQLKARFIELFKNNPDVKYWASQFLGGYDDVYALKHMVFSTDKRTTAWSLRIDVAKALIHLGITPSYRVILREGLLAGNDHEINGYAVVSLPLDHSIDLFVFESFIETEGEDVVFQVERQLNTKYFPKNIFLITWQGVRQ